MIHDTVQHTLHSAYHTSCLMLMHRPVFLPELLLYDPRVAGWEVFPRIIPSVHHGLEPASTTRGPRIRFDDTTKLNR